MKLLKYLISIAAIVALNSCNIPEEEERPEYPTLDTIANTLWYSVDTKNQIYYDIHYAETTGEMVGFSNSLREEEVSRRAFTYTFTPETTEIDALVNVVFEDGQRYGGILVPKGNFQVNNEDVYWIQLYEIDDNGYIIYDEAGKIKSSILMWKE